LGLCGLGFVCFDRISFGISCLRGFGFDCCWLGVDCVVAGFGCDCFRFTIGFFLVLSLHCVWVCLIYLVWFGLGFV
jgi:hypothetical protein